MTPRRLRYGPSPEQFLDLHEGRPPGRAGATVVLVHGGFWRARYTLDLMRPLADALAADGWTVANLEYRRVGQPGGGWPGTCADVAAALDALDDRTPDASTGLSGVDTSRLVVVGHSAGGHLALWAAGRHQLPTGCPGAKPRVRPRAVVSLAGVCDLAAAAEHDLGAGAVAEFLGPGAAAVAGSLSPGGARETRAVGARVPTAADPAALLPYGVPQLLVHGGADDSVPVEFSRRHHQRAAAAGDPVELLELSAADHLSLIDPDSTAWGLVADRLPQLAGPTAGDQRGAGG